MFAKATILSALFAGSALAAPTSSPRPSELERRADWQTGKCEAHIALNTSNGLEIANPTSKWDVNIIDNPGNPMGHWDGTNPDHIQITTSKDEKWFVIQGGPANALNWGQVDMQNTITLSYDEQRWNGMDCYKFIQKSARPSNGWRH